MSEAITAALAILMIGSAVWCGADVWRIRHHVKNDERNDRDL